MSAHAQPRLTPEEYLEIERAADFRSEYYNGCMYAMSGSSPNHIRINTNITGQLWSALRTRNCMLGSNDFRVRVSPRGLYTYPDIVVVCGELQYAGNPKDTLINPTFILEILSPSTEAYDRGFKFTQYRTIESLEEYVLVSQTEPRVEVYRRQSGGTWLFADASGLHSSVRFESIDCVIGLADIYEKVTFASDEVIPPRPPRDE